jgi:hypothetical protein
MNRVAPVKAAGNHQMQDEPKIFFEPNADSLTQATQLHNLPVFDILDWRHCGAQQKRR